jgi:cell division protein FtsI/penicillin-binding protein 2
MIGKIRLLSFIFILLFTALCARLIWWQVIKRASLADQARNQHSTSTVTSAQRGNILASDKTPWVARVPAWNVWVNPHQMKITPAQAAKKIAPITTDETDLISVSTEEQRLIQVFTKDVNWVSVKQKVGSDVKKNIEALDITGIGFDQIESSFYPEASVAAQLLGFVGKDSDGADIGYFGLEGYYNLPLSGKPGFIGGEKDAKGSPILIGESTRVLAVSGVDLLTNIDKRVQIVAENELAAGIEKYQAIGGSVTIMDPNSGKVLAIASLPSFDPNEYSSYSNGLFKNPVITDTFEPGSILKVIVMAAGIDAGGYPGH